MNEKELAFAGARLVAQVLLDDMIVKDALLKRIEQAKESLDKLNSLLVETDPKILALTLKELKLACSIYL